MDVAGEFVYGTLVIVVNVKILISSYLITCWEVLQVAGSVGFYIFCYSLISSQFLSSDEYGTFYMMMSLESTYFSLTLFTFMFVLVDVGLQYLRSYIDGWFNEQKRKKELDEERKRKANKTVIKRKVTSFTSKSTFSLCLTLSAFNRSWFCLLVIVWQCSFNHLVA